MKKVFGVLGVIVLLIAVAVFFVLSNLDAFVEEQIESVGTSTLGTPVSVEGVRIELMNGLGEISGFAIANPEGFSENQALQFQTARLDIDTESLTGKPIVIEEILLDSVGALYELNASAQGNLNVLLNQVKGKGGSNQPAAEEKADSAPSDIRLRIAKLTVKDTGLALNLTAVGDKNYAETLPTFSLTDIGGPEGLPPSQLGTEIANQLMTKLLDEAKRKQTEKLKDKAKEKVMEKLNEKLGGEAGGAVKGLLDKL